MNTAATRKTPRRYVQGARAEAAEETGRRIVDSFLVRLMTQWYDEITLERVAADAGVTVQTVIRRFGGKEGLLREAVKVLAEQINARRATPPGDIQRAIAALIEDYEQAGDPIIRLLAVEPRQPALSGFLNVGRKYHRDWAAGVLGERGDGLDGAARKRAVDALVVATDVYTWKLLRRDMGRSPAAAATMIERMVRAIVTEFCDSSSGDTQR